MHVESATDIPVAATVTVGNINASLALASKISGTVTGPDGTTPLAGILVTVYSLNSSSSGSYWGFSSVTITRADGSYVIGGLKTGTYRVGFADWGNGNYLPEYYNGALTVDSATDIPVPASSTVSGIHASLAQASKISGNVTGPDGSTPLIGIQVIAYQWNEMYQYWATVNFSTTQVNGNYTIGRLESGTYRIGFGDGTDNYVTEFHNGASSVSEATDITVAAATIITGINASMAAVAPPTVPKISEIRKTGQGSYELSFSGIVGEQYQLQESTSLTNWYDVGASFICGPHGRVISMTSSEPKIFWRVRSAP